MSKQKPKSKKVDSKLFDELQADLKRVQADFVNFKRRSEEEKAQSIEYGKFSLMQRLIPVLDSLKQALGSIPNDLKRHSYIDGIKSVVKQLESELAKVGVEEIKALNQPFDPEFMEAIHLEEGDGDKEIVYEVMQSGYTMNENVLRHAVVKVKKSK